MSIFIIAEIGINHNGDLSIVKELIDVAVDSGCDAVKFQKRDIDLVYSREMLDSQERARGVLLKEIKKWDWSLERMNSEKLIHIAKVNPLSGLPPHGT